MVITLVSLGVLLGLCGLMAAVWIKLMRRRKKLIEENFRPHTCPSPTIVPLMDDICDDLHGGKLAAFNGLICQSCNQRVVCIRCDRLPKVGEVITLSKKRTPGFRCCDQPEYALADAETPEEWKSLN